MIRTLCILLTLALMAGCGEPVPQDGTARILLLGDSMMASNRVAGRSVADVIEATRGEPVIDRSVPGALFASIALQYRKGPWDTVLLNGGGNDLLFGCGCGACGGAINRLVSQDGQSGAIPTLMRRIRTDGAQVILVGYLRNPGVTASVKACGPAANELERRLQRTAALTPGMTYVSVADLVPSGDRSFQQQDQVHPTAKGSAAIAARMLAAMR